MMYLAILSLIKVALLIVGITLIFDYRRFRDEQLLYTVWIAFALILNELSWLLYIPTFFATINHYLVIDVVGFIVFAAIVKWRLSRTASRIYLAANGIILAGMIAAAIIVQIVYQGAGAKVNMPHFLMRLIIGGHYVIMIFLAMRALRINEEDITERDIFLAREQIHIAVGLVAMLFIVVPEKNTYHLSTLIMASLMLPFSVKLRNFMYAKLESNVFMREKERDVTLELLYQIGNAVASNREKSEIFNLITESAAKATNARSAALFFYNDKERELEAQVVFGLFPPVNPVNDYIRQREDRIKNKVISDRVKIGHSYLGIVAETKEPIFITDVAADERVPQTVPGIMDIKTLIAVPLMVQTDLLGVLAILNRQDKKPFNNNDFSLMKTFSDQAAVAINNIKLYETIIEKEKSERDISIAGDIQKRLLPEKAPELGGFDISSFSYAARGVGGDYYDYLDLGNGRFGAIMVDVAGKGVPAALVMVMLRSIWRTIAPSLPTPGKTISTLNAGIAGDLTEEKYATMYNFIYDTKKKVLHYSNAAHGPLVLYRKKAGTFEDLDSAGIPVGISADTEYEDRETSVEPGDIAVLYTDGITEAMNNERQQYTLEKLKDDVVKYSDLTAKEMTDKIYADVTTFVAGAPQHDDQTLMIMKIV
ncbi:MAG: SpoIIE family protein phosphatase [Spirochaetes bacterium]|nr:SpoIIE family protein phosphatase [Spirochaetota bacterium]